MIVTDKTPPVEKKFSVECNAEELLLLRYAVGNINSLTITGATFAGFDHKFVNSVYKELTRYNYLGPLAQ